MLVKALGSKCFQEFKFEKLLERNSREDFFFLEHWSAPLQMKTYACVVSLCVYPLRIWAPSVLCV